MLDVADSGPGIPLEDRAHIFEAFYTGARRAQHRVKGTGIGLSVVLEFVTAHDGTVQIVDGEFPGAHFRITHADPRQSATAASRVPRAQAACRLSTLAGSCAVAHCRWRRCCALRGCTGIAAHARAAGRRAR